MDLKKRLSILKIAKKIGVDSSTIYREIKRNSGKKAIALNKLNSKQIQERYLNLNLQTNSRIRSSICN